MFFISMGLTVDSIGLIFINFGGLELGRSELSEPDLGEPELGGHLVGWTVAFVPQKRTIFVVEKMYHFKSTFIKSVFFEWISKTSKHI